MNLNVTFSKHLNAHVQLFSASVFTVWHAVQCLTMDGPPLTICICGPLYHAVHIMTAHNRDDAREKKRTHDKVTTMTFSVAGQRRLLAFLSLDCLRWRHHFCLSLTALLSGFYQSIFLYFINLTWTSNMPSVHRFQLCVFFSGSSSLQMSYRHPISFSTVWLHPAGAPGQSARAHLVSSWQTLLLLASCFSIVGLGLGFF